MKRIYGLLMLVCIACQQPVETKKILTVAQPETAGMSTARLARLDSTFTKWVDAGWMNGAVGFIARDGKIVYHRA
ncbi:MAG TPA: serine hydrolase, partial [Cyclobacteriaceae bacterium]|nr:serine hydrolase [Cyclobacteriaceae bacterium]